MGTRNWANQTLLDAKGATGIGKALFADDFKNIIFSFATDGGGDAALTVKFQASVSDVMPDFAAAQSVTNEWDYIEVVDLEDGTAIDGDTGVAVATADDYRMFEANINGARWVCARVTARSAGEVTVRAVGYYE